MLTPRSIQVLKRILLIDEVFTFKQVALDLDLSEKTVRNQLDEIQEFLMTYRLSLKTVPGTGSHILGNQSDKADAYAAMVQGLTRDHYAEVKRYGTVGFLKSRLT